MKIDRKRVEEIAALANLELSADEITHMEHDLGAVLEYVEQLQRIDTRAVEPMAHVQTGGVEEASASTLREDRARAWFGADEALANAPAAGEGMFLVPKIIERG